MVSYIHFYNRLIFLETKTKFLYKVLEHIQDKQQTHRKPKISINRMKVFNMLSSSAISCSIAFLFSFFFFLIGPPTKRWKCSKERSRYNVWTGKFSSLCSRQIRYHIRYLYIYIYLVSYRVYRICFPIDYLGMGATAKCRAAQFCYKRPSMDCRICWRGNDLISSYEAN